VKRLASYAPPALALVAAALLQWPALSAPFFADDWLFLDQSRMRSFLAAALSPDPIGNFFRPLGRVVWFWTLGHASGESPAAFHAANLLHWLVAVALLWALARRVAGVRVAAVAVGVFALTYAADVPVLWASGAQDLLALVLALAALLAVSHGRLAIAAALLFAAPFAKETAAVALVPALFLARRPGERFADSARRAWPLLAATLAWAAIAAIAIARRGTPGAALALSPWGPLAAIAGALRVALGMEWRSGAAPWSPPAIPSGTALVAIALAAAGVALVATSKRGAPAGSANAPARPAKAGSPKRGARPGPGISPASTRELAPSRGPLWSAAVAWIVAGALPIALVAPIWSAYYYLFAMAGVALLAGLAVEKAPAGVAAAVVLVAGFGAHQARALDEFATAPSPWSAQSHVNRFYLQRGMSVAARCVADLRAARPTVPRGSTFFFYGVPAFSAVQVADGPLVRGVYRDSTLRSYYGLQFRREILGRGSVYMMMWDDRERRLVDRTEEPDLWFNLGIGYLLNNRPQVAAEAFEIELARDPGQSLTRFGLAIARAAVRDTAGALEQLGLLRFGLGNDAGELGAGARLALMADDSLAARRLGEQASARAVFDPVPHIVLSRIYAAYEDRRASEVLEACAAVAFAPEYPGGWRNWSAVQRQLEHYPESLASLERYFALDPSAEREDEEAVQWRGQLRDLMPGGMQAQRSMKDALGTPR
jgi:tetratricopeptide (TPR) repeat protein